MCVACSNPSSVVSFKQITTLGCDYLQMAAVCRSAVKISSFKFRIAATPEFVMSSDRHGLWQRRVLKVCYSNN